MKKAVSILFGVTVGFTYGAIFVAVLTAILLMLISAKRHLVNSLFGFVVLIFVCLGAKPFFNLLILSAGPLIAWTDNAFNLKWVDTEAFHKAYGPSIFAGLALFPWAFFNIVLPSAFEAYIDR